MWPTAAKEYFESPSFKYVTVDSATFYAINEEDNTAGEQLGEAKKPEAIEYNLATKSNDKWSSNYTNSNPLNYSLDGKNYTITVTGGTSLSLTVTSDSSIDLETAKTIVNSLNSKLEGGKVATPKSAGSSSITMDVTPNSNSTEIKISVVSGEYNLATTTTQNAFFNGLEDKIREPFVSGVVKNEFANGDVQQAIQVPSFAGEVYANSTETDVILVIRLKYENNGTVEYTDLQTRVTVVREVQIVELDKVVADGEGIDLKSVFDVTDGQNNDVKTTYLNDTLEILIKNNSTARFNISLERNNGEKIPDVAVSRTNADAYYKTTYLSISSLLNTTVQEGDEITISNSNGNATFYYIYPDKKDQSGETYTGTGDSGGSKGILTFDSDDNDTDGTETITFTIQAIETDYIYVENAQRLKNSKSYPVDKYYIAQVDKTASPDKVETLTTSEDSEENEENEIQPYTTNNKLNYRVSHRYYVTGRYYSMSGATTDEIIKKLVNSNTKSTDSIYTSLDDWTPNIDEGGTQTNINAVLTLRGAAVDNTTVSIGSEKGFDKNYIWFMIDPLGGSGSGDVSINNDYNKRNDSSYDYGQITYGPKYTYDQYIEIVFRVVVSGVDRDISTLDNGYDVGNVNISYELGSILVGWAEDFRPIADT